ncbi:murein transglycosylase [Vibrio sp.]|uniref:murein transglycosylase n=1 Tax=Vibrio sp. TaxID=678 RepID=UPI003D0FE491
MTQLFSKLPSRWLASVCALTCGSVYSLSVSAADLHSQREWYDQAQQMLDDRQLDAYQALRDKLSDYSLTPYLDYRIFILELAEKSPQQVEQFISQYSELPFSNRIRAPYLQQLASNQQWQKLLQFQTAEPRGEVYQCLYYRAQLETGQTESAFKGAKKLWLSGQSIADECDPLFKALDQAGQKSDNLIIERMLLAFDSRNISLMSYLSKQLKGKKAKQTAESMLALARKPDSVVKFAKSQPANRISRMQAQYALEKLARQDADKARKALEPVGRALEFEPAQSKPLADYIAGYLFDAENANSIAWRDQTIAQSSSVALIERRVRLAIQQADWSDVAKWINRLPEQARSNLRWQYWLGRSELNSGKRGQGVQRLEALLGQRNFYSVAAATEVGRSVVYPTTTVSLKREQLKPYQASLSRIAELIARDKIAAAKSEWYWLLQRVPASEREMLAAYAAVKRWHHLTVTASIQAKMWDNLEMRFPIAHKWWFNFYGEKHGISPVTLMSLARQESALDVEAQSPVGARGIMQIMPSTAKYTAKKFNLSYEGADDLYEIGKNIEIGSQYFSSLLKQYDNNRIFALAAYNAGPHRVKRWREASAEKLDAYAFIEAIPFRETRGYVQNILMFETYYRDLMGVDGAFLTEAEVRTKY